MHIKTNRALAYYNEFDDYAAAWLHNLIKAGVLPAGDVDTRSIDDVQPEDLKGYTQCHWFAGIGVWPFALRAIGWPDSKVVWSGSCPCQGFSSAGKKLGFKDPRHKWPDWYRLIQAVRPTELFGEQVDAAVGDGWLDLVQNEMGAEDYAIWATVFPACGIGAPELRQRLFFAAETMDHANSARQEGAAWPWSKDEARYQAWLRRLKHRRIIGGVGDTDRAIAELLERERRGPDQAQGAGSRDKHNRSGASRGMADYPILGRHRRAGEGRGNRQAADNGGTQGDVADTDLLGFDTLPRTRRQPEERDAESRSLLGFTKRPRLERYAGDEVDLIGRARKTRPVAEASLPRGSSSTDSFWGTADWLYCRDDKWRPVEPGTFPLVDGPTANMGSDGAEQGWRQGELKGYGNALVSPAAIAFVMSYVAQRYAPRMPDHDFVTEYLTRVKEFAP